MADQDGFFRGKVVNLLLEEENEAFHKTSNPLFMEATAEVSRSLFYIKCVYANAVLSY